MAIGGTRGGCGRPAAEGPSPDRFVAPATAPGYAFDEPDVPFGFDPRRVPGSGPGVGLGVRLTAHTTIPCGQRDRRPRADRQGWRVRSPRDGMERRASARLTGSIPGRVPERARRATAGDWGAPPVGGVRVEERRSCRSRSAHADALWPDAAGSSPAPDIGGEEPGNRSARCLSGLGVSPSGGTTGTRPRPPDLSSITC